MSQSFFLGPGVLFVREKDARALSCHVTGQRSQAGGRARTKAYTSLLPALATQSSAQSCPTRSEQRPHLLCPGNILIPLGRRVGDSSLIKTYLCVGFSHLTALTVQRAEHVSGGRETEAAAASAAWQPCPTSPVAFSCPDFRNTCKACWEQVRFCQCHQAHTSAAGPRGRSLLPWLVDEMAPQNPSGILPFGFPMDPRGYRALCPHYHFTNFYSGLEFEDH